MQMTEEEEAFASMTRTQQGKEKRAKRADEERKRRLKQELRQAEAYVQEIEAALAKKEEELSSPVALGDPGRARRLAEEYAALEQKQQQAYNAWEAAEMALEEAAGE